MVYELNIETEGTCAKKIRVVYGDDGLVRRVEFAGGCPGGLSAVAKMCEFKTIKEVAQQLSGITCGKRDTSCVDQLAKALIDRILTGEHE